MSNEGEKLTPDAIQSRLAAVLESVDEAVISTGRDGTVRAWNRAAKRIFGYSAEEIVGKPISILTPANQRRQEAQILERVQRGERVELYEVQRAGKDERSLAVRLIVSPIHDEMGQVIGALTVVKDIAERKRLEQAELDQLFLAAIVSSAGDAIMSKNLGGIVTSWNKAAEKLFGYTAEEMIGRSTSVLIPPDHFDEEPDILERTRRGERIDYYETKRLRKDQRLVDVALTVSPIKDSLGRIIGASTISRNITDRKLFEKAETAQLFLGALVGSAEDAIISKTLDGIVTSWNSAAEKLFGYTADEMIGQSISTLIPADHFDEERQILERIRRGESIEHYQTVRVRKDGRQIHVGLTVSPIRDALGRIVGASKIARDITEQIRGELRLEEAVREAQEAKSHAEAARLQAEEASRAKDEFLATISHELRTPLSAILGWSRMLLSGKLSAEQQESAIKTIDRNARCQAQLIEDLLDISRIISGKLRIEFSLINLEDVIAAAIDAVQPAAEAKQIRVQRILEPGAGQILGDAQRLQQVLWNLLSNAIRFTPVGGLVKMELHRIQSHVELRVSDNGIGIKRELLPRIFDRFTQGDSSTTRSYGGLGMGLAIVKSLVALHGGIISASSPGDGKGATFTIMLPVRVRRQELSPRRPSQKPSLEISLRNRHELVGLKILVVDDEPDTCELLRFVFTECGSIVKIAHSAPEALELFDSWQPDVLVSDIAMPGFDGYKLIRIIRDDRHSDIPAVALTAMARIEDRMRALTAGYQMHVAKPVEPSEVINIVSGLVGLVDRHPKP